MKWINVIVWALRFCCLLTVAYTTTKTATRVDLMLYSVFTVFSFIAAYLVGLLFTIGCNDGKNYIKNKIKKNETK